MRPIVGTSSEARPRFELCNEPISDRRPLCRARYPNWVFFGSDLDEGAVLHEHIRQPGNFSRVTNNQFLELDLL